MGEHFNKEGIKIFDKPEKVKFEEWMDKHLDCDALIDGGCDNTDYLHIIAYSLAEKYNVDLDKVLDELKIKYPRIKVLKGITSFEVNTIF